MSAGVGEETGDRLDLPGWVKASSDMTPERESGSGRRLRDALRMRWVRAVEGVGE